MSAPADCDDDWLSIEIEGEFDVQCALCGEWVQPTDAEYDALEQEWYCDDCIEAEAPRNADVTGV